MYESCGELTRFNRTNLLKKGIEFRFMVRDAILFEDLKLKNLKQASIDLMQRKSMIITELAESKKDHAIELLAKLKVGMDELQKITEDRK
ncbi:hypothetical protein Tco_1230285 [Tanacetum coccineum]